MSESAFPHASKENLPRFSGTWRRLGRPLRRGPVGSLAICFLVGLATAAQTYAVTRSWYNDTGPSDWFIAQNWTGNTVPSSADEVRIVLGGTAVISTPGAVAHLMSIGYNYYDPTSTVEVTGSGTLAVATGLGLGSRSSQGVLEISNGGTVTIGPLSTADLSISDEGLAASLPSTGLVTVSDAGSLLSVTRYVNVGGGDFSSATLTVNGGLVQANEVRVAYYSGSSVGVVNINGTVTGQGVIQANAISGAAGAATVNMNGGIIRARSNQTNFFSGLDAGDVNLLAGGGYFDTQGFNVGFGGVLTGVGSFTKQGTGVLTLSGTNTHQGGTIVNAGLIAFSTLDSFGSGSITLDGGGLRWATGTTTDVSGRLAGIGAGGATFDTNGNNVLLATALSGAGSVTKSGLGTITLSGGNTYAGGTTLTGGMLTLGSAGAMGSTGTITLGGGTLQFSAANATDYSARFSIAAGQQYRFDTNGQNVALATALTSSGGTLTKLGSGTLTLSATGTYTGATAISGGTLALGGGSASPSFAIASGATLELQVSGGDRDFPTMTLSGSGNLVKSGTSAAYWAAGSATFALGSGALIDVQAGGLYGGSNGNEDWSGNLSGLNVASGAAFYGVEANVRVDALTGAGLITSGYSGSSYQSFTFGVANGSGTFSGVLADHPGYTGNFTKAGNGTQSLTGTSTYTGTTAINAGKLVVDGSIATSSLTSINSGGTLGGHGTAGVVTINSGGLISPGDPDGIGGASPGTLSTGAETWAGGAGYVWELNDASSVPGAKGVSYDWLNSSSALNITATSGSKFTIYVTTLTAGNVAGATPGFVYGTTYHWIIATGTSVTGFSADKFAIDTSAFFNGSANSGDFSVTNVGNDLMLNLTYVPEPSASALAIGALLVAIIIRRRRMSCQ